MGTEKRAIGHHSRATEGAKNKVADAAVPPDTPTPTPDAAPEAPRLNRGPDPDEVQVKGREAGKAGRRSTPNQPNPGRAAKREACRDCQMYRKRLLKVWMNFWRKETPLRPALSRAWKMLTMLTKWN